MIHVNLAQLNVNVIHVHVQNVIQIVNVEQIVNAIHVNVVMIARNVAVVQFDVGGKKQNFFGTKNSS